MRTGQICVSLHASGLLNKYFTSEAFDQKTFPYAELLIRAQSEHGAPFAKCIMHNKISLCIVTGKFQQNL